MSDLWERLPRRITPPAYFVGLDLGKMADYTAIAGIRRTVVLDQDGKEETTATGKKVYDLLCNHLDRFPLGTSYPTVVRNVKELMSRPALGPDPMLCVDSGGVGQAVVDLFRDAQLGCQLTAIQITGGSSVTASGDSWNIAKCELMGSVQAALSSGRLKFAKGLDYADIAKKEFFDYRVRVTAAAHETFNAREGAHDDVVLAVAMAVHMATYGYYSCSAW